MSDEPVNQKQHPVLNFIGENWFKFCILCAIGYGLYIVNEKTDKNTQALADTLVQMKTLKDGTVIFKGNLESALELERRGREQMGRDFMTQVSAVNGTIIALHSAVGKLEASIQNFGKVNGEKKGDGSFTAVIDQDRGKDKLPLTAVSLKYDATKSTLTEALKDSQWLNNRIEYDLRFGEWRTDKDGIRSAAILKQKVFKGETLLGEEVIPLQNAEAFYSKDNVLRLPSPPKFNLTTATIHDTTTGRNGFLGILDTKVTRRIGISTGFTYINGNKTYILGTSWSFGNQ